MDGRKGQVVLGWRLVSVFTVRLSETRIPHKGGWAARDETARKEDSVFKFQFAGDGYPRTLEGFPALVPTIL